MRGSDGQAVLLRTAAAMFPTPAGRYVLDQGRWFTSQARPKGVRQQAAKACYRNAGRYVINHPELNYAEGFAACMLGGQMMVVQHAWVVDGAGQVIDPTWRQPEVALYFGIALSARVYAQAAIENDFEPLFHSGRVPAGVAALKGKAGER